MADKYGKFSGDEEAGGASERYRDMGDGTFAKIIAAVLRAIDGNAVRVAPPKLSCVGDDVQITDLSSATAIPSVPEAADMIRVQVEGANVRWKADGNDPTGSVGTILGAGDTYDFRLDSFVDLKFILVSGTPKLNVSFWQDITEPSE